MKQLVSSWEEFMRKPFPSNLAGENINGVDLVEVDSYTAGCITTYIETKGTLDQEHKKILKKCLEEIQAVIPLLKNEEQKYFSMLFSIGNTVIKGM